MPRNTCPSARPCAALLFLCLFLLFASTIAASGQTGKGTIQGIVTDAAGAAVQGAQVVLSPLSTKVVSDGEGHYRITQLPAGAYSLTVSYVGFSPQTSPVAVLAEQTVTADLQLKVANASEEILVEASRPHGEAEAINEMRTADNLLDVIPSEVIRSLPNANIADATGRLPGVTLYRIEGEGVYIQVRSTEPRLTNVTVDGITIPAPEPTVRQVRLDIIPSDMVDGIELNKTLLANMDANGIGGSVNLRTKEASEKPTLDLYSDGGYTPILNGRNAYDFGGTIGRRFGMDKKLGLLFNATYDYNGRGIDNIQPKLDPLSTFATPFYDSDTIREYRYYRTRYGYDGSADYRLNSGTGVYARAFYSDLQDYGDKWYYSPISAGLTCSITTAGACANGAGGNIVYPTAATKGSNPKFYTSNKRPNVSVGTIILGGRSVFGPSLLTYQISASRSYEQDSAGNPKADFSWASTAPTTYCNYIPSQQTDFLHPHFANCDNTPASPLLSAANWTFADITTSTGLNAALDLTAQTSYSRAYRWAQHSGMLDMGFKFSSNHQTQDATENVYDTFGTAAPSMTQLLDNFSNTDYYNGTYFGGHYGQVSNFSAAQNYTLQNLSSHLDGQKTAGTTYPNLFHTVEQVTAGYIMDAVDFGKLHVNLGLRIEATREITFGYNLTYFGTYSAKTGTYAGGTASVDCPGNTTPTAPAAGNCYVFTGVNNNPGYIDLLPSAQFRYGLTNDANIRAVYSRGVARPDPYQLVPYVTEDTTANPISVLIGNPSLRPEHANNYDLLFEQYLRPLGLVQAGFFFKQLNSPQILTTLPGGLSLSAFPTNYFPPSIAQTLAQYPGDAITQYTNGQNAYLYGLEFSFQQHFGYLPGVLGGLGVTASYTYTGSREKGLPLRSDHPQTIDQSPNSWRVSPTYDTKRFSARVGLAFDGASLFSYNYTAPAFVTGADPSGLGPIGPSGDVYTLTHFQTDAEASYRFWKGLRAVVSGLNLNNEVFGYYTGNTQFVNQREYYKPTYSGGLRYSFSAAR